jgi:Domain of unknown function (DUF1906)
MGRIRKITVITAATGTLMLGLSGVTLAAVGGAHASHTSARSASAKTKAAARTEAAAQTDTASATELTRVINYRGYHMKVPASWPVYRLGPNSSRCVLFNRHAIYLGTPGADPRCPVSAVGKTEALLVQPLGSQSSLPPQISVQQGKSVEMPSGRQAVQDAVSQILQFALPKAGVRVTASYGHDPSLIRSILRSAHLTAAGPAAAHQSAQVAEAAGRPGGAAARRDSRHRRADQRQARRHNRHAARGQRSRDRHSRDRHGRAGHAVDSAAKPATGTPSVTVPPGAAAAASVAPDTSPTATPSPMPLAAAASSTTLTHVTGAGLGFDTCTVPTAGTMKRWLASPFRMIGTYLGGDNWACNYGNFSKSWVTQVAEMGWRFIPLWVGPQAPCTSIGGAVRINSANATAQGRSQAASAVSTAAGFGYGKGSPIYFDMEGYDNLDSSCSHAVLSFLSGWTQGLHKAGYLSGVYSSASSGMADLASQYHKSGYSEPNDMWFADWDRDAVVTNSGLPSGDWPGYRRVHQFDGPNVEKFGGISVNIDDDYADGDVAGLGSPPGAYALGAPDAMHLARGASGHSQLLITAPAGKGSSQTVQWQVQHGHGVSISPDQGTAVITPGQSVTIKLKVKASKSAPSGRDNFAVSAHSGSQALSGTTLLISVGGHSMSTPKRVVLYAADHSSIKEAERVAEDMALPGGSVTGSFKTAWRDAATGKSIVLAVGEDALNALYHNPCDWTNPYHQRARSTPFIDLGGPLDQPPGKIYFEDASGADAAQTAQITDALTKYALTGTLPSPHAMPASPSLPGNYCAGVPSNP